jgi:hypothetical protein
VLPYRFPALRLNRFCLIVSATALTGSLLVGCGSSGVPTSPPASSVTTGRAALTIRWPERDATRLIPFAANSIRVRLTSVDGTRSFGETLLVRPTNGGTASATFSQLPTGPCLVTASAYPGADGSGVAQATGQTQTEIVANQTAEVRLTLASTIDRIELNPTAPTVAVGQSVTLSATVKNPLGEVMLTAPSTVAWTSSNTAVATVEPGGTAGESGTVRGVAPGTTTITVTEQESGKTASVLVTVPPAASQVVYETEFDGTVGTEWSRTNTSTTPIGARRFLGQFNKESVTLSLSDLPAHTSITISYKLFLIRSWDGNIVVNIAGNTVGQDVWALSLDNSSLLRATFGNWAAGTTSDNVLQSYPNAAGMGAFPSRTGASENNSLGFVHAGNIQDSVYNLTFTVPHTAQTAVFDFSGLEITTEGIIDESWGIDSVRVTVSGQ